MKKYIIALIMVATLALAKDNESFKLITPAHGITIHIENDYLFHDRHYTHGTEIRYRLPNGLDGFCVGQLMYTPNDISIPDVQVDERPYAAWLYFGATSYKFFNHGLGLEVFESKFGILGPPALGEEIQTFFHEYVFTGSATPMGWDNQLHTELGVTLRYQKIYRKKFYFDGLDFNTIMGYGGIIGNVHVNGNLSGGLQFGYNIPDNFGNDIIVPTARLEDWSFYVFAGAELRLVGVNMMLDGNMDGNSHSIGKETIVADFRVGSGIKYKTVAIDYSITHRTDEFVIQPERTFFSALNISIDL